MPGLQRTRLAASILGLTTLATKAKGFPFVRGWACMRWRIWVGALVAVVGALLLGNYIRLLPEQPPFAPTTAILWALSLLTLAGLLLVGWGLWRQRVETE